MTEEPNATLASRDTVNRACGILLERHGMSQDQALQRLVRDARDAALVRISQQLIAKVPPVER
ncbi:ANTAR domain-containing protein [Pseudarthrobacter sp. NamE5]|uniref:ANTAR domain-containing protein n=1 Tax=Pseudarthrobacter sp. NamE5 TaxID=2576839 RepID=UPI001F0F890D|nr:ANTAR domain-containing protein [Pseudarthrobacter sp. NamE5]